MTWLEPIPIKLREQALRNLEDGNVVGFLCSASNDHGLDLVYYNKGSLLERGLYEKALLDAYSMTRVNNHQQYRELAILFALAQRDRLVAAGDPLPGLGPFTLYRGVAGHGRARRVQGYSWTASKEVAKWFALRPYLPDPAVFMTIADASDVLAYLNERNEQEYLLKPPLKVARVWPAKGDNIAQEREELVKRRLQKEQERFASWRKRGAVRP